MKRFFIGASIFVVMLTLSACGNEAVKENVSQDVISEEQTENDGGMVENMMEKMAGAQKCVLRENGEIVSTVYMDGERMRADGDASVLGDGEPGDIATTLSDGEWMYMWSHEEKQGMKMKIEEEDMMDEEEMMMDEEDEAGDFDEDSIQDLIDENADKDLDYSCEKWRVDEKMFIPPTDVEFVDMAEMMQGFVDGMSGGAEAMEGMPMELPEDVEMPQM